MNRAHILLCFYSILICLSGCASLPSIHEISEPELVLSEITFEEIRIGNIKFHVWLDITNTNKVPLYIDYIKADLFIEDSALGAAETDTDVKIGKLKTKRVKLEYSVGMAGASQTLIRVIQNRDFAYMIKGIYYFNTVEGLKDMPFERKGYFTGSPGREHLIEEEPEGEEKEEEAT